MFFDLIRVFDLGLSPDISLENEFDLFIGPWAGPPWVIIGGPGPRSLWNKQ